MTAQPNNETEIIAPSPLLTNKPEAPINDVNNKLTFKEMKKQTADSAGSSLSKEQILADRETRRLAKLAAKHKQHDEIRQLSPPKKTEQTTAPASENTTSTEITEEKSRDKVMAEREMKKQAKQLKKKGLTTKESAQPTNSGGVSSEFQRKKSQSDSSVVKELENLTITTNAPIDSVHNVVSVSAKPTTTTTTKAERRAIQEAQRASKAKQLEDKKLIGANPNEAAVEKRNIIDSTNNPVKKLQPMATIKSLPMHHRVKLFSHLYVDAGTTPKDLLNSNKIHPAIVKLGAQYASRMIVGSNARCLAFMAAMKCVIQDYRTPSQKEFARGLEENIQPGIAYLHHCRPLAVSVINAIKFIKWQINQLPTDGNSKLTDHQLREKLLDSIDTHIRDQIEKAAQAISISVQEKISNGDVILTFGCSSLINHILEEAQSRKVNFRVIVVDARPDNEGRQQLERLVAAGIKCSFILINAIGFIMPDVTKVLLGAHALLANGYVTARAGTAQVALIAKTYNVPVLVCCETHKFSERVQTDAFVYNELGNPSDIIRNTKQSTPLENWTTLPHLTPLNLKYDITPPELVTAVVTELAIMPCTSVPVILRIKPSEIGY